MSMEMNKIMAAVLVAGITATFAGFVARETVHPEHLHENAVKIEGVEEAGAGGAAAPTGPEPILGLLAAADIDRGEKVSKACAACHNFDKNGPNGTGPNLWGIVDRARASHAGFEYSDAMKAKTGNWSYAELNHFLWKPKAYINGTKMTFIGLKKPEDRAAVIAWLRTLADSPRPLPSDAAIKAEEAELAPPAAEAAPEGKAGEKKSEGKTEVKPSAEVEPSAGH